MRDIEGTTYMMGPGVNNGGRFDDVSAGWFIYRLEDNWTWTNLVASLGAAMIQYVITF